MNNLATTLEVRSRTFVVPNNQSQFIHESIFNNATIRWIAIAMNTNTASSGTFWTNPFQYRKFDLRELGIVRGNRVIVRMDTRNNVQAIVTTIPKHTFVREWESFRVSVWSDLHTRILCPKVLSWCSRCHSQIRTGWNIQSDCALWTSVHNLFRQQWHSC